MQTYRILIAAVLCVFLVFFPVKSQAQSTTEPDGWEALVHYYEGQYYTGTLSLGRIPPGGPSYATPSAACTAATNFANQLQPSEPVTGAISGDYEYGIEYPIFSYDEQKYLPIGYFGGYRCQLQREGASPAITAFGWSAHVAVVIIPACPAGTGAAFFDGEVVCGEQFVGKNIGKAGTCEDGDTPLTQPKPCKVGNPIAVDTGEKIEQEQDYATDDGLFSVKRWYRSAQRDSLTTTDTPGFGRNWRGLLPGRLVAKGLVSGSQITNYQIEYQSPEGSFKRFYQNGWAFQAADVTRLKLGPVTEPPATPLEYFKESVATINMQGDFKLSYANGDYILFSRAGIFNTASLTRTMVPVERGFANGYKIWFDYPDNGQYPNKIRDNLNREMLLSWEDIGWASATLVNVRKGPTPTPPSPDASREKAITSIVLPDQTTVNYSYGVSESSGFKGRLETVLRKNATGAVLWGRGYLYEDMRFPYAITGKSDQNGNRLSTYSYDANGNAVLTERAGGFDKQKLSYGEESVETDPETGDAFGVTEQVVTNSLGRETRYKFVTGASNGEGGSRPLDTPARILAISGSATSNVAADTKRIAYSNGQISGSADANGNGSSQTVDLENRRPTSTVDANGTQTQITWHPTLDIPTRTVRKRLQTDYSYDAAGQLTSMSQTDLDSVETRTMQLIVGVAGRTQAINGPRAPDAQGRDDITAMTYDAQGNRLTMSNALGHVTRYEGYDANGRAARVIDANGTVTELVHDDLGRLKTTTVKHPADPAKNAVTAMDYDVEGRVVAITRPDTTRINFDYNLAGLMTAIRSEDGERIDYSYDAMGNRLAETVKRTDGTLVSSIVRTFDEIGRMLTKTLGPARTHRYEYDKVGNAVRVVTARGGVYENSFDALNRLVETVTPDESTFSQYYDGDLFPLSGLVTSPGSSSANELGVFEDGNGVKTRFTRNAFGQVKQEISPDRGTILYEYDAAGDLAAMVDGRGQRVDYVRDILGRVSAKTPAGRPLSERVTYTYDIPAVTGSASIGRLSRIDDGTGATRFAYDHRGNLVTRFQKLVGTPDWVTLRYAYDLADRVDTMTYPSGRQVRYVRNAKGQIVTVRSRVSIANPVWTIVSSNMSYEAFGALKGITFGNGERMVVTRGDDGRLDGRRLYKLSDGSNISHLTYGYDADDNMTRITDKLDANNSLSFVYDPVDRMKRVTAASGAMRRTDYVFDGNGNRIKKLTRPLPTDPPSAVVTENYSMVDASNRLSAITSAAGNRSFVYDARGNIISETRPGGISVNAGYDGHGRLFSYARTGEASLAHVYNGIDDRVATTTGGDTRRFVYAPDGRVLGEYGSNAGDVRAEFIWMSPQVGESGVFGGDDGLGGYMPLAVATPDPIAGSGATQLSWVHANHMGVPIRYSDASGTTLTAPTGYSVPGFLGQSQTAADLYYNRYRDYNSGTGRYIQADPIGLAGGASPLCR